MWTGKLCSFSAYFTFSHRQTAKNLKTKIKIMKSSLETQRTMWSSQKRIILLRKNEEKKNSARFSNQINLTFAVIKCHYFYDSRHFFAINFAISGAIGMKNRKSQKYHESNKSSWEDKSRQRSIASEGEKNIRFETVFHRQR